MDAEVFMKEFMDQHRSLFRSEFGREMFEALSEEDTEWAEGVKEWLVENWLTPNGDY